MLYDGAIDAVRAARSYLASGDIYLRSRAVAKAVNILIELSHSLNYEAGGDLSRRLAALYDFMQRSLLDANFRQTDDGLATTETLLISIREAWATISGRTPVPSAQSRMANELAALPWPPPGEPTSNVRCWSA